MDLARLASVAEIINALAVTLTLIGLIVTIRQSGRSQKALAVDSLAAAIAAINVPATESPVLGSALLRAVTDWGSATREERIMAHFWLFSFFRLSESAWYQRKSGILDPAQWQGWDKLLRRYYHSPGVRNVWWPSRSQAYSEEFRLYLEASVEPPDVASLAALFEHGIRAPAASQESDLRTEGGQ